MPKKAQKKGRGGMSCCKQGCAVCGRGGVPAMKRGLGGDILGAIGGALAPGWGGHLGRGVGDAIGSVFGFKKGGRPVRPQASVF
jgi:hypothetical protein